MRRRDCVGLGCRARAGGAKQLMGAAKPAAAWAAQGKARHAFRTLGEGSGALGECFSWLLMMRLSGGESRLPIKEFMCLATALSVPQQSRQRASP